MDFRKYHDIYLNYRLSIKILAATVVVFALLSAWLVKLNITQSSKVQYVLVPTSLRQPVYVGSDRVDAWYLKMMTAYVSDLTMNFTPSNINQHVAMFLKFVDSSNYTNIVQKFRKLKDVVKENKISQVFSPVTVKMSAEPRGEKDGLKFYDIKGAIEAAGPCYRNIQTIKQSLTGSCTLRFEYLITYGTFKIVSIETASRFKK